MRIELSKRIAATPERVFDTFSDFRQADQRLSGIEELEVITDGPIGVGTEFRETRKMMGQSRTETMRITAFDRPTGYTVETETCGAHFVAGFAFEPVGAGTSVTMIFTSTPMNLFAWMMSPLAAVTAGPAKQAMQRDIDELAALCEAGG